MVPGTLTINPRPITVTIEIRRILMKIQNEHSNYSLETKKHIEQNLGLVLSRESGNDVGTYDISANNNKRALTLKHL